MAGGFGEEDGNVKCLRQRRRKTEKFRSERSFEPWIYVNLKRE